MEKRTIEVDAAVLVHVHLGDEIIQLGLAGVEAERFHHITQLLGGDRA